MARLSDLSHKLLLRIAVFLHRKPDFRHLALTCRHLLPIGRERLYFIVLLNKRITTSRFPARTAWFLQTILERPEIAKLVKTFDITYSDRRCGHVHMNFGRNLRCICGRSKLRYLVRTFFAARPEADPRWIRDADREREPALLGIILVLLSELSVLSLQTVTRTDSRGRRLDKPLSTHTELTSLFGGSPRATRRELGRGLQKLQRFRVPQTTSWEFTKLSSVKHFEMGLTFPHNREDVVTRPSIPLLQPITIPANITSLRIHCDVTVLSQDSPPQDVATMYLKNVLSILRGLRRLVVYLVEPETPHYDDHDEHWLDTGHFSFNGALYARLMDHLLPICDQIESLVIDPAPIVRSWEDRDELVRGGILMYLYTAFQANSFTHFTKLKRLVLPYECLVQQWMTEDNKETRSTPLLPATLRALEIVEPKSTTKYLLKRIYKIKRRRLPHLEKIVLHPWECLDRWGAE